MEGSAAQGGGAAGSAAAEVRARGRFGCAGAEAAAAREHRRRGRVGFRPAGGLEYAAPVRPLSPSF
eukprot:192530-Alexandrium_andersonii.AAC.1